MRTESHWVAREQKEQPPCWQATNVLCCFSQKEANMGWVFSFLQTPLVFTQIHQPC